ncbi:MAG: DUF1036 domain-containing protein [Bacteroidota bacterium]
MKAKHFLLLVFLAVSMLGKAQVNFKNNYSEPVWVSFCYYLDTKTFKGWVSKGWYKVIPGQKTQLLEYLPEFKTIYYFAKTKNGAKNFEGTTGILVDESAAFTIFNADKDYVKKENPKYAWKKFREYKVELGSLKLWTTIDFNY